MKAFPAARGGDSDREFLAFFPYYVSIARGGEGEGWPETAGAREIADEIRRTIRFGDLVPALRAEALKSPSSLL